MTDRQAWFTEGKGIDRHGLSWLLSASLMVLLLILCETAYWRSSGVGPQVQVPMFYDAHYLYPRPWTQEQSAPGIPNPSPVALYGPNAVSQSFVSGANNLAMVSTYLAGPAGSKVKVLLQDDLGKTWYEELTLSGQPEGSEHRLAFPAIPDSKGRQFTLQLTAPAATNEDPILIHTVGGDRLGSSLYLNEFSAPGNLAMTSYSKGLPGLWWFDALAEQMLPAVFRLRLQQYKPEPFKGSLFSWLLIGSIAMSAILIVVASPQNQVEGKRTLHTLARSSAWFLVIMLGSLFVWQIGSGRALIFPQVVHSAKESALPSAEAPGGSQSRVMVDLVNNLWTAEREPEPRFVSIGQVEGYPAIKVPGDSDLRFALTVAPASKLRIAPAIDGQGELWSRIQVNDQLLSDSVVSASADRLRQEPVFQELDLSPWAGQGVVLTMSTKVQDGEPSGLWLMPQILSTTPWLLADLPASEHFLPLDVRFNDSVELLGVLLDDAQPQGELEFPVTLIWRASEPIDHFGKVFVHVLNEEGQLIAQHDGIPVNGVYPFSIWPKGAIIQDEHLLQIADGANLGQTTLSIGIYDPETLERWPAEDADGTNLADRRVTLELQDEDRS